MKYIHTSKYFYGKKLTDEEIKDGYISYATLASCFDAVLCNNIASNIFEEGEQVNGFIDNSDEINDAEEEIADLEEELKELEENNDDEKHAEQIEELKNRIEGLQDHIDELQEEQDSLPEVFQWFIISDFGAKVLNNSTNELVYYLPSLDVYVWGVCHWGTSWASVSTDIRIELEEGGLIKND